MEKFLGLKNKYVVVVCSFLVILLVGIIWLVNNNAGDETVENYSLFNEGIQNQDALNQENSNQKNKELESNEIFIHIDGEVNNPGLIRANEGERISDIIDKAGGITESANVKKINLAYMVEDGQKITIPSINDQNHNSKEGEKTPYIDNEAGDGVLEDGDESGANKKVNINTATQTQLETLSGIGPSIALKIIEYRNSNGKFKSIEDLKSVQGVGNAKYESIKDSIVVK